MRQYWMPPRDSRSDRSPARGRGIVKPLTAYRQAIWIKPDFAEAHCKLGNALRYPGKLNEAFAACRQAIRFKPGSADARCNLGTALRGQGKMPRAIHFCETNRNGRGLGSPWVCHLGGGGDCTAQALPLTSAVAWRLRAASSDERLAGRDSRL